ncbi:hypothetical protein [Rhodopila sp.]|uniref:hypothetical protein n=1 Tax=Rhodopila sp. TaxID=2480087 RepID=UPI003D0EDF82
MVLILLFAGAAWGDDDLVLPSVDFSATDVQETGALLSRQTIHYTPGILRIDRANGFSTTILDLTTQTQYLLMANHTYLVLPMDDALFRRYIARTPAVSGAVKAGTERIEGLKTTKYIFGDDGALDAAGAYWLTDTGIMVRRDYDDGVFGQNIHHREFLTGITFAKQPPELFKIPASYRLTN